MQIKIFMTPTHSFDLIVNILLKLYLYCELARIEERQRVGSKTKGLSNNHYLMTFITIDSSLGNSHEFGRKST